MPVIAETAYPRLPAEPEPAELEAFTPEPAEIAFARQKTRQPGPRLALLARCCRDPAGGARSAIGVAGRPSVCPGMPALPFKLNQDRRRHIPEQTRKVTNWRDYNESLRRRGSLTVWFSDEAVKAWRPSGARAGAGSPSIPTWRS